MFCDMRNQKCFFKAIKVIYGTEGHIDLYIWRMYKEVKSIFILKINQIRVRSLLAFAEVS